jgi:hypothetical protein
MHDQDKKKAGMKRPKKDLQFESVSETGLSNKQ